MTGYRASIPDTYLKVPPRAVRPTKIYSIWTWVALHILTSVPYIHTLAPALTTYGRHTVSSTTGHYSTYGSITVNVDGRLLVRVEQGYLCLVMAAPISRRAGPARVSMVIALTWRSWVLALTYCQWGSCSRAVLAHLLVVWRHLRVAGDRAYVTIILYAGWLCWPGLLTSRFFIPP